MDRLLVAIPVFNERARVQRVVAQVQRYVADVLVIDDGSDDGTTPLIHQLPGIQRIFHPENRGYGQALISAFQHAARYGYDWLITMDCDEQHEPEFIPHFIRAIEADDADIISGSRYLRKHDGDTSAPPDRRRINQIITQLLNDRLGLDLTDAFCGFKAYRVTALEKLDIDVPGYAVPLQFWVQVVERGLRIREIPVRLIYNDPNRYFGDGLDDPHHRLAHYLAVFHAEMLRAGRLAGTPRCDTPGAVGCP